MDDDDGVFVLQLLQTHPSTDGLQRLMKIYEEEDETYRELVSVATQFYQNLLQPFRDMREIATLYKTEILVPAHITHPRAIQIKNTFLVHQNSSAAGQI